ncbi:hypothetical protein NIB75_11980 [Bacteroides uniformis]|nr:hypothetical protein [Bacteroides uniformis]
MPFSDIIVFLDSYPNQGEQVFHLDLHLVLFGSNRCGTGQVICLGANVNRNLSAAFDYRRIGIVTDNIPHLISKRHFSPTPYFAIINKFLVYACVIIEQSYLAVEGSKEETVPLVVTSFSISMLVEKHNIVLGLSGSGAGSE